MRSTLIGLLVGTFFAAGPAFAAATTYECKLDVANSQNWVASTIIISHDPANDSVVVIDPIIDSRFGKPIEGKVSIDNAKRITFTWDLPQVKNSSGQFTPRFLYRATYIKATGKVSVIAKPLNYKNDFQARGACAVG